MANGSNSAASGRGTQTLAARSPGTVKWAVWAVMGLMTLSVLFWSELPLLRAGSATRTHILEIRWLLVPHVAFN